MEEICGKIKIISDSQQAILETNAPVVSTRAPHLFQTVTLPTIELPKFDGNVIEWYYFRDMIQSLVHKNQSILDIERFHYLCCMGSVTQLL